MVGVSGTVVKKSQEQRKQITAMRMLVLGVLSVTPPGEIGLEMCTSRQESGWQIFETRWWNTGYDKVRGT